ncbi:uncharacterized protein LOC144420911 [Styela clava]
MANTKPKCQEEDNPSISTECNPIQDNEMAAHKIKQEVRKQWDEANLRKLLDSVRTQITNRNLGDVFSQYIEKMKSETTLIEAEKQQQENEDTKLTEARDNLIKYLDSIRQMCESEQIAGTEYEDTLNALCNETEEWLKSDLENAEWTRRQAEERRKKAKISEKLKNYIDRAQRLTVFEPLTSRLTKLEFNLNASEQCSS